MTATQYAESDVEVVKRWVERTLYDTTSDNTLPGQLISNGILMRKDDLTRGAGDEIKYHFLNRLSGKGLRGSQAATGNEKALTYHQDILNIDKLREAVQIPNDMTISAQRVQFDLPEDAYQVLKDWAIERMSVASLYQLAGYYPTTLTYDGESVTGDDRLNYTGLNPATEPTTNQRIYAGTSNTTDQAVNADSTATFSLKYIDEAENRARKNRPYIKPLDGRIKYHCYVHVDGFKQIIQDTTAPIQYRDMYLNMIASGKGDELIGQSVDYSMTRIISTDKLPNGVHSSTSAAQTNVRRAVFCGKEAGCIAFGKGFSSPSAGTVAGFNYRQDTTDIEEWRRISINMIFGVSKTVFNSQDHGTIVISHYA